MAGEELGVELPIVVFMAPADWFHGILWEEMPERAWRTIPVDVRRELESLGLGRSSERIVYVAARESEVKELGLDPSKPITLEDLKEKIVEQLTKKKAIAITTS